MRLGGISAAALLVAACGAAAHADEAASKILAMPESELVALVQRADATTFERAKAIQRLGMVGGAEATRVLASQLDDEELNAYARSALEAIGDAEADAALREAAGKLHGRPLAGVLNSLGERRDANAVEAIEKQLKNTDADVRSAAAVALGEIGSEAAAKALTSALAGDASAAPALGDACLVCADRLAPTARGGAMQLYNALIESSAAKPVRLAAMLGRIRLQTDDAGRWIAQQLVDPDVDVFNLTMTAARELDSREVTMVLRAALPKLAPGRQALVLRALGARQGGLPVAELTAYAASDEVAVRAAAIDILADHSGPEAARALVDVALGKGAASSLALERLKTVKNDDVDRALDERAGDSANQTSVALVQLAGARGVVQLKPFVARLASHEDADMRRAAIVSLGQIGDLADMETIITRALGDGEEGDVEAARKALRTAALRLDDRNACAERLAKELNKSQPETRDFILRLLREMGAGSNVALVTVIAAANSADAGFKEAGTRELGAWPTTAASEALLTLAKSDTQVKYRVRALRGYIRIARQLQLSDQERLEFFHAALDVAQRDDERRLALGILERIPSVETLNLATSYLNDRAMASAAAETAVRIAAKLILSDPSAVAAAMSQVKAAQGVEMTPEASQLAEGLLQRAGGGR